MLPKERTKLYIYPMLESFGTHIKNNLSFLKDTKLLIAISGGVDSLVLTHLCRQLDLNIALAHCNFNLRGDESDGDEKFLLELSDQWNLELFVQNFDTESYAETNHLSVQMAARELRYQWFDELSLQLDFDYVLTAHHADDNLETFLINLSRGSGLDGLKGIPEINGNVIRPLLEFSREHIINYANENKLEWREDSSNESSKYLRNKIRKEVIPSLKSMSHDFLGQFKKTQSHLRESSQIVEDRMDAMADDMIDVRSNGLYLNIEKIKRTNSPKAYLYQLLKDFGFTDWEEINDLLDAQSGKQIHSEMYRLLKDREYLILTHLNEIEPIEIFISDGLNQVDTSLGVLNFEKAPNFEANQSHEIYVDYDCLEYPLILRKWQNGDVFHPIGMKGKKKLSKYFKDEKLSLLEKESAWLLCSNDKIIWVIGMRADERFKVQETTESILKISLH